MRRHAVVLGLGLGLLSGVGAAQGMNCNMQGYKAVDGLRAVASAGGVTLTWTGEAQQELRAEFALRDGQPVVAELAAQQGGRGVGRAGQGPDAAV
jgi:hypothetical protein